jgi:uncharacterized membrane protein YfcA
MTALFVLFLAVATVFSALGQGGGAFYVPLLLAWGVPFHHAAAASQSVILAVSLSSMVAASCPSMFPQRLGRSSSP